jgi:hypothetical protein
MKNFFRKISLIVIVGVVIGMFPIDVHAESEEYLKGYITDIVREEVQEQSGYKVAIQVVKVIKCQLTGDQNPRQGLREIQ